MNALKSISIRLGYERNSAVTTVYVYDNGGKIVTEDKLKFFCNDNSKLTPIGSIHDEKRGYRTAKNSEEGNRREVTIVS